MSLDYQEKPVPQLKPIDKETIVSQTPEQVWKERLSDVRLYHGTSDLIVHQIQQTGLLPNSKPYLPEDNDLLIDTLKKLNLPHNYAIGKNSAVYLTADLASACGYAIDGPEMLRIFYLDSIETVIQAWETGIAANSGVSLAEIEKIKELRNKTIAFLNKHRPALVVIKQDSKALASILQDSLGKLYNPFKDPHAFETEVKQIVSDSKGMSEKEAAEYLADVIKRQIGEIRISKGIPPEDLSFKLGREFDGMNGETKRRAERINNCFHAIDEQPSELIHALDNFVFYDSGIEKDIANICKYYNIGPDKAQKIIERVQRLKEEESK